MLNVFAPIFTASEDWTPVLFAFELDDTTDLGKLAAGTMLATKALLWIRSSTGRVFSILVCRVSKTVTTSLN